MTQNPDSKGDRVMLCQICGYTAILLAGNPQVILEREPGCACELDDITETPAGRLILNSRTLIG